MPVVNPIQIKVSIDSYGQKQSRRAVASIMKRTGAGERKAAAEAKRAARAAKRIKDS